jgi:hypothetical protein
LSAHNLDLHAIDDHIVKSAIEAMNSRNKKQWYELFSDKAELTDDGNPQDFSEWSERELFGSSVAYLASIESEGWRTDDLWKVSLRSMGRF